MYTVRDVIDAMNRIAPPSLALDGDPIGLHAGAPGDRVRRIMLSLDASLPAVAAAEKGRADMLVVHHPRFYRGIASLAEGDPSGRRAAAIVRSRLAVFSAHTNLDLAEGGTNDQLAAAAGIISPEVLKIEKRERLFKMAVFVPASHIEAVRKAVCDAGAGHIGKYSCCTFRCRGTGTFRAGPGTKPFLGREGVLEEADEYRLETVFGEFAADAVVEAMKKAHPYEEAAYDLFPLAGSVRTFGLGRVGELLHSEPLAGLAGRIARTLRSPMTQFHGRPGRRVRRIAVWAGAGFDTRAASAAGAEAVIAGEIGYHDVETLADADIAVITVGHGYSEELVLRPLAARLMKMLPECRVIRAAGGQFAMRNVALKTAAGK